MKRGRAAPFSTRGLGETIETVAKPTFPGGPGDEHAYPTLSEGEVLREERRHAELISSDPPRRDSASTRAETDVDWERALREGSVTIATVAPGEPLIRPGIAAPTAVPLRFEDCFGAPPELVPELERRFGEHAYPTLSEGEVLREERRETADLETERPQNELLRTVVGPEALGERPAKKHTRKKEED